MSIAEAPRVPSQELFFNISVGMGTGTEIGAEIKRQCELVGIIVDFDPAQVNDWPDTKEDYVKPIGFHVSQVYLLDMSLDKMAKELGSEGKRKKQRRGVAQEGISLVTAHPETLDNQDLILSGTAHGTYDVLKLSRGSDGKVIMSPIFSGFKEIGPAKNPRPFRVLTAAK